MKHQPQPRPKRKAGECVECGGSIPDKSDYIFFCSMSCAADWGEDEALMQWLAHRAEEKKAAT